jgi:hypothetical protein
LSGDWRQSLPCLHGGWNQFERASTPSDKESDSDHCRSNQGPSGVLCHATLLPVRQRCGLTRDPVDSIDGLASLKPTPWRTFLVQTKVTGAEQAEQAHDDQIDCNNEIEQARHDQNEYPGDQRYKGSDAQVKVHADLQLAGCKGLAAITTAMSSKHTLSTLVLSRSVWSNSGAQARSAVTPVDRNTSILATLSVRWRTRTKHFAADGQRSVAGRLGDRARRVFTGYS